MYQNTKLSECEEDFVGKTISAIDAGAINELIIYFDDGTTIEIEAGVLLGGIGTLTKREFSINACRTDRTS